VSDVPDAPDVITRRYALLKRRLAVLAIALDLAYLMALVVTGLARAWADRLASCTPWPWAVALYVTGLALPWTLALLPLDWARGFWVEHRFGLSRERARQWFWRWSKVQFLGGLLLLVGAEGVTWALRAHPATWWGWVAAASLLWSIVLTQWMPVVLLPLFYRQRPLADAALTARLRALAQAAGTSVSGAYEIDLSRETSKANACLCGLGTTRRILVTDTLTRAYTPDEIVAIFAHELGHHQLHHLPRGLGLSAAWTVVSCWLVGQGLPRGLARLGLVSVSSLAALPVVALGLSLLGLVWMPIHNGVSRRWERAADRFALELTRAPQAFIAAMRKLQQQNLAEAAPPKWVEWLWYDHPPIAERIAMAEQGAYAA